MGLPKKGIAGGSQEPCSIDFRMVGDHYVSSPPSSALRWPGRIDTGESYRNTYVQYIILSLLQHVLRGKD